MMNCKRLELLGGRRLWVAVVVGSVVAASSTSAFGQGASSAAPAATGKPFRHELPVMEVPGTDQQAQGRYVEFPAGFKSPTAFHAGEEMGYVISGDYTLTLEGQAPLQLKGGDTFSIPKGVRHGFSTVNGAKLVAFWVVDRGLPLDLSPER